MPKLQAFSIPNVIYVATDVGDSMNFPFNLTNVVVNKYVQNNVFVFIRDVDRAPVNVGTNLLVVNIYDARTKKIIVSKTLSTVNATIGQYSFTLDAGDLDNVNIGSYSYSITSTDTFGNQTLLYTGQDRTCVGTVTVASGVLPGPIEPTVILWSDFRVNSGVYYSGAYAGSSMVGDPYGLHTIVVYPNTGFSGIITLQGSLITDTPSSDVQWFDVGTITLQSSKTNVQQIFQANLQWFRLKMTITSGTIQKIAVRV